MNDSIELVFKDDDDEVNTTNYSFACSHEMRKKLHEINNNSKISVPDTFRKFAKRLIESSEKDLKSLSDTVA